MNSRKRVHSLDPSGQLAQRVGGPAGGISWRPGLSQPPFWSLEGIRRPSKAAVGWRDSKKSGASWLAPPTSEDREPEHQDGSEGQILRPGQVSLVRAWPSELFEGSRVVAPAPHPDRLHRRACGMRHARIRPEYRGSFWHTGMEIPHNPRHFQGLVRGGSANFWAISSVHPGWSEAWIQKIWGKGPCPGWAGASRMREQACSRRGRRKGRREQDQGVGP